MTGHQTPVDGSPVDGSAAEESPVDALSSAGRAWRVGIALVLCAGLLAGTVWGKDDQFPVGPFRMYSTRQRLDGSVSWYEVRLVTAGGDQVLVEGWEIGLRRAEVEGQRPRLVEDPALLCLVASTAIERGYGGDSDVVEVRLVKKSRPLRDGRPTGETVEEVRQTCVP